MRGLRRAGVSARFFLCAHRITARGLRLNNMSTERRNSGFKRNHIYNFLDDTGYHDTTVRIVSERVHVDPDHAGSGHEARYLRATYVYAGPETQWKWRDCRGGGARVYLDEQGTLVSDTPERYDSTPDPESRHFLELWGQEFDGPAPEIHPAIKLKHERMYMGRVNTGETHVDRNSLTQTGRTSGVLQ